jgi:Zn-dependent alcohol dehydrogenase
MQTEALVVEAPGAPFKLQQVTLSRIQSKELLVEIKYSGLCHTVSCRRIEMDDAHVTRISSPSQVICHTAASLPSSGMRAQA